MRMEKPGTKEGVEHDRADSGLALLGPSQGPDRIDAIRSRAHPSGQDLSGSKQQVVVDLGERFVRVCVEEPDRLGEDLLLVIT